MNITSMINKILQNDCNTYYYEHLNDKIGLDTNKQFLIVIGYRLSETKFVVRNK